ncbi:MAG: type II toxin-antitoxin system Phd/YefM family antitoxin [Caulobacteraceae bacterium]|nr:type II toxin-antitoxin system Phd/YefM family antitoxin [Caulobacteraceae bacterium]
MPKPIAKEASPRGVPSTWKLEDAKARFSEVVRRAHVEGPQAVTVRGRRAVVVIDADDYERLAPSAPTVPLVDFLERMDMGGLDLSREPDAGRDVEL